MKQFFKKICNAIKGFIRDYDRMQRCSSTELLEWEHEELTNIFGLILFGFIVGYPSAPMHVTVDLLPVMDKELHILLEKIDLAHEPISELFSLLDIG